MWPHTVCRHVISPYTGYHRFRTQSPRRQMVSITSLGLLCMMATRASNQLIGGSHKVPSSHRPRPHTRHPCARIRLFHFPKILFLRQPRLADRHMVPDRGPDDHRCIAHAHAVKGPFICTVTAYGSWQRPRAPEAPYKVRQEVCLFEVHEMLPLEHTYPGILTLHLRLLSQHQPYSVLSSSLATVLAVRLVSLELLVVGYTPEAHHMRVSWNPHKSKSTKVGILEDIVSSGARHPFIKIPGSSGSGYSSCPVWMYKWRLALRNH